MTNKAFENIWKIIKENKFQLINEINYDFICNICNKLMVKACNAPCDCKYCYDCIGNYLDGKERFCPGKNELCHKEMINFKKDIIINYQTNSRISKIVVKCPNINCEFKDELSMIENHMRTCDKNLTSCPYIEMGCKNDGRKDHFGTEIHSNTNQLLDFINNLRNEMESMNVELKSENNNLKKELDKIKIESKNNQMKNDVLNKEMVAIKNENRSLMDKLDNIEKSRINEVIEEMQRKFEQQTREIDEMKEKCEQAKNKEIETKRISDEIFSKNADLMNKLNNYDEIINNLQIQTVEMKRIIDKMNFGELEWKIENFNQQQRYSDIFSESFHSHKYGYKMCLSVVIEGGNNRVLVRFHLMRGDFDDVLEWPFKHAITIDIINPMNGNVFTSKTIKYDDFPNLEVWNKPAKDINDAIRVHDITDPKKVIRKNLMLVSCSVKIDNKIE